MAKIAVDVVLLPSEAMADKAIEANRELLKQYADKIVLDKENCLPHISLAMGCIDERDIAEIEKILHTVAEKYFLEQLSIVGVRTGTNPAGEKVSVFQVERTETIQSLHEEVMRRLMPYFSYDVTADMVLSPPAASESTLLWVRNYPEKSSFKNFFPHITIGYGQINDFSLPIRFAASKLALCHLGNHCTCRKILAYAELKN
ncbi:MAG: 2'-5' RNA ligase family protein [Phycisphaerae bacterium]